jgi:hypothetical protein
MKLNKISAQFFKKSQMVEDLFAKNYKQPERERERE